MIVASRMVILCALSFLIVLDIGFVAVIDVDRVDVSVGWRYFLPTENVDRTVV